MKPRPSKLLPPGLSPGAGAKYVLQLKTYPNIPDSTIKSWTRRIQEACKLYFDSRKELGLPCHQKSNGHYVINIVDLEAWYHAQELGVRHAVDSE